MIHSYLYEYLQCLVDDQLQASEDVGLAGADPLHGRGVDTAARNPGQADAKQAQVAPGVVGKETGEAPIHGSAWGCKSKRK